MSLLTVEQVSKGYGKGPSRTQVLDDINLTVDDEEFVAIVGFSGSGKTTLMSLLAGLIRPDTGEIKVADQKVTQPGPERGLVFQNYSLLPWMTVHGNVHLAVKKVSPTASKKERNKLTDEYIDLVGLYPAKDKRPGELSGGMRQRVALARGLAMDPKILLLDEPLSALDALTRTTLQSEIESIWQRSKKTVVMITNDVDEAILLADRIIPLHPGPNATLGPAFKVDLARPRDRTAINHDPVFKGLRTEISAYLLKCQRGENEARDLGVIELPTQTPVELGRSNKERGRSNKERRANGYLELTGLGKTYDTPKGPAVIVEDFNLVFNKGDFVSLIGHSGCGKSTVLSMVAGLNVSTTGGVVLDGQEVDTPGPDRGVVFQAACLLPWLSALDNVLLGIDKVFINEPRSVRKEMAQYYLDLVGLADSTKKYPAELSGGMQQRVGVARAFALRPKVLLLDEPFGMLDSLTRLELQDLLLKIWDQAKITTLMVTHDVDEALYLSDRVAMMTNGPRAGLGELVTVPFSRPRDRLELLKSDEYYQVREQLIGFLEGQELKRGSVHQAA